MNDQTKKEKLVNKLKKKYPAYSYNMPKIGRPRTWWRTPEKMVELGEDLVKWVSEESDEPKCLWSAWYAARHGMLKQDWDEITKLQDFKPYYLCARAIMAKRLHNNEIDRNLANRYVSLYDRELFDHEEDIKNRDSERKKKENSSEASRPAVEIVLDKIKKDS